MRVIPRPESPGDYTLSWDNPAFESWDDLPPVWGPPEREP